MDKTINCQQSFYGVSISSAGASGSEKKASQIIRWGLDTVSKLSADSKSDTFERLGRKRTGITLAMRRKRQHKPWWVSGKKLEMDEYRLKDAICNQQAVVLEKEAARVNRMEQVVSEVERRTQALEDRVYSTRQKDKIETHKAAKQSGENGFSSIAGYNSEKNILNKYFISEIEKEKNGEPANVPGCVLFFGPTGNGKTTFAKAFAKETDCYLAPIRLGISSSNKKYTQFWNKLMGAAKNAEKNFQEEGKRTIIFIDEFAKISNSASPITAKVGRFLETCSEKYHCTVFAATNNPLSIKLPLTGEKSVFPYKISLDPPNKENKAEILKYYLDERLPKNTDYTELSEQMEQIEGKTGGRFNIAQIKDLMDQSTEKNINIDDVKTRINDMTPAITKETLTDYNNTFERLMDNQIFE